jgi:hypothetical protein
MVIRDDPDGALIGFADGATGFPRCIGRGRDMLMAGSGHIRAPR